MELAERETNTMSVTTMSQEMERSIDLNDSNLSIQESTYSPILNNESNPLPHGNRSNARRPSFDDRASSKRQRKTSVWPTNNLYRDCCGKSLKCSRYSKVFRQKLANAGFHSCKDESETTICFFCSLRFGQWDENNDCPAYTHKRSSPHCSFVLTDLQETKDSSNDRQPIPVHCDFIQVAKRFQSFDGAKNGEELAQAGLFRYGSIIKCFYCDGSFSFDSSPLDHIRLYPNCCFAQNYCGYRISEEIRRANQNQQRIDRSRHHGLSDPTSIDANSVYDLIMSGETHSLLKEFPKLLVIKCLERHGELTGDYSIDGKELYVDCLIRQRLDQMDISILIPKEEMIKEDLKDRFPDHDFERRSSGQAPVAFRNLKAIETTFSSDVQSYCDEQKELALEYKEDAQSTIAREISTKYSTRNLPDSFALLNAGWIIDRKGDSTKCPCCLIEYNRWKPSDDPKLIHQLLSPNCLFIQSTSPLRQNEVEMKPFDGYYANNSGTIGGQRSYNGVAKLSKSRYHDVSERIKSFDQYPNGPPENSDDLAINGFFYSPRSKLILCFYCYRLGKPTEDHLVPNYEHFSHCNYDRQMKDNTSQLTSSEIVSELCGWCHEHTKQYVALPCRHLVACRSCVAIRRTCPTCHTLVENYSRTYQ